MSDWLRIRGGAEGERLEVEGELTVGRGQPGLGRLGEDNELSRSHARLARTATGGLTVEDLGSTNGTLVNGKRISGIVDLRPGDVVELGSTELEVVGDQATPAPDPQATRIGQKPVTPAPAARRQAPVAPAPPDAATRHSPAVPAPRPAAAPQAQVQPFQTPPRQPSRKSDWRVPTLAILLVLALGGIAAALVLGGGDDKAPVAASTEPAYTGTAYVLSNRSQKNQNSVIAMRYGANGFEPLQLREYPTGGTGSLAKGNNAPTDGDQQIVVDRKRKLLFAVNQGSDTVAVFKIADDGTLTAVKGSPFPSGGTAPVSIGLSQSIVIVLNKGVDGQRKVDDPATVNQFQLGAGGTLTPIGEPMRLEPGTGPAHALVIDRADLVVIPELLTGPYRTMLRGSKGTFAPGPTTPITDKQRAFGIPFLESLAQILPPGTPAPTELPPLPQGAEGLSFHPEQDLVYSPVPPLSLILVHSFDKSGKLTFVKGVKVEGGLLVCWSRVTPDGRYMYVSNAATHSVAVFDLRDPRDPLQIQLLQLDGGGGHTSNLEIDPSGKRIYLIDSYAPELDAPGAGNEVHAIDIGPGGQLAPAARGSVVKLPVQAGTSSYGMALFPRPKAAPAAKT